MLRKESVGGSEVLIKRCRFLCSVSWMDSKDFKMLWVTKTMMFCIFQGPSVALSR